VNTQILQNMIVASGAKVTRATNGTGCVTDRGRISLVQPAEVRRLTAAKSVPGFRLRRNGLTPESQILVSGLGKGGAAVRSILRQYVVQCLGRRRSFHNTCNEDLLGVHLVAVESFVVVAILLQNGSVE